MNNETINMISLEEFIRTMLANRKHNIESLNSFMFWIEKKGCPNRWPFEFWEKEFEKFLNRKI